MLLLPYHLFWTIPLLGLPALAMIKKGRIADRMAFSLPAEPLREGNIWIHALSVGEVISSIPLVDALRRKFPDRDIVFTSTTAKGMSIARAELKDKIRTLLTMPVDSWWCIRRIIDHIKPSIFLLIETDIWPGLMAQLKGRGVKSILINGRISPGTYKAYHRFPRIAGLLFKDIDFCLMQSNLDMERLLKVKIDPGKVKVVGNIKFDREWLPMRNEEHSTIMNSLGLHKDSMIWVAGSTHPGEEAILLDAYMRLKNEFPRLSIIIAPRKIERGEEILALAKSMGLGAALKTDIQGSKGPDDVIILNTLGELARVYGLADVSFVGGSMVPFGGHNMLEPASFGCPVVYGIHTENFVDLAQKLQENRGGWRVENGRELYDVIKKLLDDPVVRQESGRKAKNFVGENRGALGRVMNHISANIN